VARPCIRDREGRCPVASSPVSGTLQDTDADSTNFALFPQPIPRIPSWFPQVPANRSWREAPCLFDPWWHAPVASGYNAAVAGKRTSVSPIGHLEETHDRNDPPDKWDDLTPIAVMTGNIYELFVTFSASPEARHTNTAKVGLDTCAGCNLIRRNQLPHGAEIRTKSDVNRIQSAQGQNITMVGEVTLTMKVAGSSDLMEVDFVVVEELVVPALLGTPWINRYIWSIDPPQRSVLIQIDKAKEPFRARLSSAPIRLGHPIRVSREQTLPPFSETWVNCNSNAKGLSLLHPSRRRDRMIQVKNGIKSLPHDRDTFSCLVASFSDHPRMFSRRQVIG
jgi:hypothetical protein